MPTGYLMLKEKEGPTTDTVLPVIVQAQRTVATRTGFNSRLTV